MNATVICVNNNKGGSLKTTTATNLAGVAAKQGKKVLIVDADNQSNVAITFGINPDKTPSGKDLSHVLMHGHPASNAVMPVHENIDILPAGDNLIGFDFHVIGNAEKYPAPFTLMKEALDGLRSSYDYIFIDTPPSLSLIVANAFVFADKILIPLTLEAYSMRSLVKVLDTIEEFKEDHNASLEVLGVVPTMVQSQTKLHNEVFEAAKEVCDKYGINLYITRVPKTIAFATSVAYNQLPATLMKRKGKLTECYSQLWEEMRRQNV